jgi:hypothetical protein
LLRSYAIIDFDVFLTKQKERKKERKKDEVLCRDQVFLSTVPLSHENQWLNRVSIFMTFNTQAICRKLSSKREVEYK